MFSIDGLGLSKLTSKDATRLKRIITFLMIALVAMMLAKIASVIIDVYVFAPSLATVDKPLRRPTPQDISRVVSPEYNIIVSRNIFDSDNELADYMPGRIADEASARRTKMPIDLVGTIVVSDPSRSVAAIYLEKEKKVQPFVLGDTILAEATVHSIARRRVVFRNINTGQLEYVEMKMDEQPDRVMASAPTTSPDGGIRQVGEGRVLVERQELDRALADVGSLLTQARAVPHFERGAIAGFRLLEIQPGSIYERLGAQNGDIIKSVNGVEIRDPATAMALFQQLQTTSNLQFVINRGGQEQTFSVDIR